MNRLPAVAIVAAVGLGLPAVGAAQHVQCHTDTIGSTTYTNCDGPPQPHGGTDPSFILRGLSDGPTPVDPLAIALQAEQLRTMRESNALLAEQRRLLAAQREALAAAPAAAPPAALTNTPSASLPAPGQLDGHWWLWAQEQPLRERLWMLMGLRHGIEAGMMVGQTDTPEEQDARTDRILRPDLNWGQIITKLDGYYADPTTLDTDLAVAVLAVMAPPQPR